ncbi:hypothetical protein V8V91_12200 [Algoriphagus halophilus]|uniref:hypothetical protein n=1 Tax=Algoriphagus halophilus TaxID=226505 RepID=UPI00358E37C5
MILDNNKNAEATLGVELVNGWKGKGLLFDDDYDYVSLNKVGFLINMIHFLQVLGLNLKKMKRGIFKTSLETVIIS